MTTSLPERQPVRPLVGSVVLIALGIATGVSLGLDQIGQDRRVMAWVFMLIVLGFGLVTAVVWFRLRKRWSDVVEAVRAKGAQEPRFTRSRAFATLGLVLSLMMVAWSVPSVATKPSVIGVAWLVVWVLVAADFAVQTVRRWREHPAR